MPIEDIVKHEIKINERIAKLYNDCVYNR